MTSNYPRFWDSSITLEEVIEILKANRLKGPWAIGALM
jgi:hypothetical protein